MITCLHGFLGRPADWDFLQGAGFAVRAIDLFRGESIPLTGDTLLGYSMGGRLALQALVAGATYKRAVIVSTGLNLTDEKDRSERRNRDERWAERFESEAWDTLMSAWNRQSIFGGHALARNESDFDRGALASALRRWSPGVLPPLEPDLNKILIPILWIAGESDQRYVKEARRAVELLPDGQLAICPGAGHRLPWENSGWLTDRLREFTVRIE